MRVCVFLAGGLRELAGRDNNEITINDPELLKVRDVISRISLQRGDVGLVMCGERSLDLDDDLADGMVLAVYPVIGGG